MRGLIRQSLRILQLPIRTSSELAACRVLSRFLGQRSIRYADSLIWTRLELSLWKENGIASDDLRDLVQRILSAEPTNAPELDSEEYFRSHERLRSEHGLDHDESTAFLSHLNLAIELVRSYRFTGARVTQVLGSIDTRVHFSRQSVSQVIAALGFLSRITIPQLEFVWDQDGTFERVFFADADLPSSAEIASEAAAELGFRQDLESLLLTLAPTEELRRYTPYIQILHFQCVILEFFDHSVLDLYEFGPRGTTVMNLIDRYPASLVSAGNPFLNNAKSVGTMDSSWVDSKKTSERDGARALFRLLSAMDEMSYTARRELAMIVRSWIMRLIRLAGEVQTQLPEAVTLQQAQQLIDFIGAANTGTLGILEQRYLDTIASLRHPGEVWRQRGIGDSVNATNVSRRKLGDCDFQNAVNRQIIAYEAHGGTLSSVYIQEHLRTLRKVVPLRKVELEAVAPIEEWQATVRFFAHEIDPGQLGPVEIDGLTINFELATFDSIQETLAVDEALLVGFASWFLPSLRARRTPEDVRLKVLDRIQ
jgi:hypothetical protein